MRILLLSSTEYPHIGGQSVHMETLGDAFKVLGHQPEYLSTSDLPPSAASFLKRSTALLRRFFGSWLWLVYYLYVLRLLLGLFLWTRAKRDGYDIIHAQDPMAYASTHLVRTFTNIPVVLTVHGYFVYEAVAGRAKEGSFIWYFLQRWEVSAFESAETIFAVDQNLKRYVVGHDPNRTDIILMRNFVNVEKFSPSLSPEGSRDKFGLPNDKFVILCPRRLAKKCGVVYAAYAMKDLRELWGDGFVLVYAGEGPEKDNILDFAERNALSKNVVLLGSVPHGQMATLLRAADATVIPSISIGVEREATSISALESMASGVPVVASDIGGLRELILDGKTGYLVPERNPKAMASLLKKIATESQEDLSRRARSSVVADFSHIARAKEFLRYYDEVSRT